ncbi:MAG: LptF/LptG family permease [Elusimicrobiota bacterium]|jgi:lipopolysaccharide export system permease protein|nr:LptF/LptG family permease [Elusimicrobiota bacterium]
MIKTLYFYTAKKFIKLFIFCALGLALIVLISEIFYRIGLYMQYKTPISVIAVHLLTRIPWQTILAFPMATLLALLFSMGDLSQKNEITAIKAAGINLWKIISMFIIIGFFIGVFDLIVREFIVPKTTLMHEQINKQIKNESITPITKFSNFILSLNNNIRLSAQFLDTQKQYMQNIVIEYYNEDFHIQKFLVSEKALWKDNSWFLINGVERRFDDNQWLENFQFESYDSQIHLDPQELIIEDIKYASMTTKQLKKYINQLRIFGNSDIAARIQLNARYSMVFCHIIVMLIGIPFALNINNKIGKIINFTLALGLTFMYWGIQAVAQSMGQNNMVSPFIAAWLPNFIFLPIGIFMLSKIKK